MALITQRDELLEAVKEMDRLGLVSGSRGNASVRIDALSSPNAFLVTPAGLPYPSMTSDQLVAVADTVSEALRVCALVQRVAQVFINAETIGRTKEVPEESSKVERRMYLERSGLG